MAGPGGPPLETFRTNKATVAIVALVFALPVALAVATESWDDPTGGGFPALVFGAVVVGICAMAIIWLMSVRVSLHQDGICYRDILHSREMRWDDVDRFYYRAVKRSINFIPVGTYYKFRLVSIHGETISFGNRAEKPAELGSKLIDHTFPWLFKKNAQLFDSNVELDFGPVRLRRSSGVKLKKWFRWREIPWSDVLDYRIEHGEFYLWRVGEKRTKGSPLGSVPNAFVLVALLDAACGRN